MSDSAIGQQLARGSAMLLSVLVLVLPLACNSGSPAPSAAEVTTTSPIKLQGVELLELTDKLCSKNDQHDVEKRHAATLLGIIGSSDALSCLHQVLVSERNSSVRAAAARAVGEIGAGESVPELENALLDPLGEVRVAAALALGNFDTAAAVAALQGLAAGPGPEALAALEALGRSSRGRETLPHLFTGPAHRFEQPVPQGSSLQARTWFVDASKGNDDGEGTASEPFRSLSRAVSELRGGAGDSVFASSGSEGRVFHEEVSIRPEQSGTPGRPTIIAAWPDQPAPILDGALAGKPGEPGLKTGLHVGASFVLVRGLVVRNYVENGIQLNGSTRNMVIDCRVERCDRHGIFAYYSPHSTILRPDVRACFNQGISVRSSPGTSVLGGRSEDNGIDGLLLLQDSDDVLVENFTASGNKRGIALTSGSNGVRIIGSRLHGNSQSDLAIEPGCDADLVETTTGGQSKP